MKLRPGRNLIALGVVVLITSLVVFIELRIVRLAPPVLGVVVVLLLLEFRLLRRRLADVSVTRTAPDVAGRGQPFEVRWHITRRSTGPLTVELRDCVPDTCRPRLWLQTLRLPARRFDGDFSGSFSIAERGEHRFGDIWIRLSGPLKLLEAQRRIEAPHSVRVLPEIYHSRGALLPDPVSDALLLDRLTHSRQHGGGTELESLAEFREGDDPRRVDWRATARAGHLVARRFQVERHRDVILLIDCGRLMASDAGRGSKLDCAVDAALMVAQVALRGGDRCGIGLFDNQVLGYLPPVSGSAAMHSLASTVYAAQTRWHESDFSQMFATLQSRQSKRSLIVVLSDLVDAATTQRFRSSLASLSRRHVVMFAALRTPLLEQVVQAPVTRALDGARKAVSFRLLRERMQALHAVRRGGITVLDVMPAELTIPLINQFVELRSRNLV